LQKEYHAFIGQAAKLVGVSIACIVIERIRGEIDRKLVRGLMLQVKEDILTKIMRAPVNLFFDVTPNSVIMHRFNGQIHELAGITHRALWIVRESISIFISIFMIC
jgi:hypothetical protein